MIKDLIATTLLATAVGSGPLLAYNTNDLTASSGWTLLSGDGQRGTLQVLINDGRQHKINTSNTGMAFDEACYYVANWYDNYKVNNPYNVDNSTRLLGFIYNDCFVASDYVSAWVMPLFYGELRSFNGREQTTLNYNTTLSYSMYMWPTDNVSQYKVYDDGDYSYCNYHDVIGWQSNVLYVRGNDITFRKDVLCNITFHGSWDDWHGYFYNDTTYQTAYESGFTNGIANGRIDGYESGYQDGLKDGINSVPTEDNGVFGLVGTAFNAVGSFLSFQIAPNISLGMLFSIPIMIGIVFVVIKFVKG